MASLGGQGDSLPVQPWLLRFKSREMESGFLHSRRTLLVRRIKWLLTFYIVGTLTSVFLIFMVDQEKVPTAAAAESFMVQVVGEGVVFVIDVLLVLSLMVQEGQMWRHVWLEAVFTAHMILSMAVITLLYPTRYVKLVGYELGDVFDTDYGSDSSLLLMLDGLITAVHLGLPIRWFILLPLALAGVLMYGLNVVVIGSEETGEDVMTNLAVLVFVITVTVWNKREAEVQERGSFLGIIGEKALRCQAEHRLAQAQGEQRPKGPASEANSAPTDRSGAVFDARLFKANMTSQLEILAAKGESEHWRIPSSEVRLLQEELLGEGGFGSVKRAVFCGMMVAVKCPRLDVGVNRLGDLCNELRILRHLRHPHIVTSHGAVVLPQEQEIHLVLELVDGSSLTDFVGAEDGPSTLQRYQVMLGVCRALLYMHSRAPHIVHGDLKGDNIMVERAGAQAVPKVLDFGLSRVINSRTKPLGGTLVWMAPELVGVRAPPVHCSADVYSFGHVVALCATGTPPMRRSSRRGRKAPRWPEDCPFGPCCELLVQACLELQRERRPTMPQVHHALLGLPAQLQLPGGSFLRQVKDLARLEGAGPAMGKLAALPEEGLCFSTEEPSTAAVTPAPSRRAFPELPETSRQAMAASLMAAFRRWNFEEKESCCQRHACARMCLGLVWDILAADCAPGQLAVGPPRQCENCGALGMRGAMCDLCGWKATTSL